MISTFEIIILIILFLITFCITYLYGKWALIREILDIPSERSSHDVPVPRGGGIAFVFTFYIGLVFLFFTEQIDRKLFLALLPGLVLAITGFIEDIKRISLLVRLIIQFICAGLALFFLDGAGSFFGIDLFWTWNIIALIGIVWFTNVFNFLDGIDGYASMEAITISIALWLLSDSFALLFLAFSVGGFLYWNWPKAKIFMGDSGSTTLGFILAVIGIYLQNQNILEIYFWLIITSLFWFDATITLFRRMLNKEDLSRPHKNHIYQRAVLGGFSHLKTMICGLGINLVLFSVSFLMLRKYISLLLGLMLVILLHSLILWYIEYRYPYASSK
jgi:Fuc2NAc and GlcNAc transferase